MNKGFGLIEVIVSVAIVAVLCIAFTGLTFQSLEVSRINASELKASLYLQEFIEGVKDLEQSDWEELLSCTGFCHLEIEDGSWAVFSGPETIDIYQRRLSLTDVYRDSSGEIVSSGGVLDTNTKKIICSINWDNKSLEIQSYVHQFTE